MVLLKTRHDKRPVFLNLFKIHLPHSALVSILHRITGVANILALPLLVFLILAASRGSNGLLLFSAVPVVLIRLVEWLIVVSYMYHVLAGVRHLYHDFSGTHSLLSTTLTARVVLGVWGLWMLLAFIRVWWVLL